MGRGDDGGPSWTSQDDPNETPNRWARGTQQFVPLINPILSIRFASLLVRELLIFLHVKEVLEVANWAHKNQVIWQRLSRLNDQFPPGYLD